MIKILHGHLVGKQVKTPDGIGILIGIQTPSNGLYVEPKRAIYNVWYGVDNAQNGKVSWEYVADDIKEIP